MSNCTTAQCSPQAPALWIFEGYKEGKPEVGFKVYFMKIRKNLKVYFHYRLTCAVPQI